MQKNRRNNVIINAACVNNLFKGESITLFYRNLATRVFLNKDDSIFNNIDEFPISKGESNYQFEVEARTLTSILSEIGINHIDFISLDVEGYELEVLQGLDFNKTNVNYILIETNQKSIIEEYLYQFEFKIIDKLSHHDYLFQRRIRDLNP